MVPNPYPILIPAVALIAASGRTVESLIAEMEQRHPDERVDVVDLTRPAELPGGWKIRCACGVESVIVRGLKSEAVGQAARMSGFREVAPEVYACRKCAKKAR